MSPAVFGHGRLRLYLLKLLDEAPRHGYDVIRELEDRFMGLYSPSAGTVYPRLARLETEGLVTHEVVDGRKVYAVTDAGRAELAARQGDLDDLEADIAGSVRDLADEIRTEVRGSVRDLKAELKAAAREVRRESRAAGRTAARDEAARARRERHGGDEWWTPLGDDWGRHGTGEWWRGQVGELAGAVAAAARRRRLSERQVAELRDVLTRAVDDVRRILADDRG